jgi:DNA topoisomerase I
MDGSKSPGEALVAVAQDTASAAGLLYVTDSRPGIRRLRQGDRFHYVGANGDAITDSMELDRIAKLAVPPAYEDVWICANPRGHLQATGRDARGRKQYRYHPKWRAARDGAKFARMAEFAAALPRLRRRLRRDLHSDGLSRDKVLAVLVTLLDVTRVRIGNAEYARTNDSYGLTTLRNRHVKFVRDGRLLLRFRGKGGAAHEIAVDDARLVRLVRNCHQLPGQRLFQYIDESGELRPIDSDQVNAYLKEALGADFTAKDFRTWGATLRAVAILHATPLPDPPTQAARKACIVRAVKQVAADLRNTPAVCRKSYINPIVFTAWEQGDLHAAIRDRIERLPRRAERIVIDFLNGYARRSARAAARQRGASLTRPPRRRSARKRGPGGDAPLAQAA